MTKIKEFIKEENRSKLKKKKQPEWIKPMLATLTDDPFSDNDWIYERKFDGERCIVVKNGKSVKLLSRNKKNLTDTYPEIQDAVKNQNGSFIIDGEIVAFKKNVKSFERLQERMKIKDRNEAKYSNVKVYFYIFDLMFTEGYDLRKLTLTDRKRILKQKIKFNDPLRFTIHRNKNGEKYLKEACRKKWEGLIAKDMNGTYVSSRSKKWLKFKCVNQQELVIGGYTDPEGERIGFGALLVGFYEDGNLKYAGKVGTGYDDETLKELSKKMRKIKKKKPPFGKGKLPSKNVHWIKPNLVAEIGFTEWTKGDKLRHPRYLGLRDDKDPEDVVKEKA